ncbi:glycerol-3-phosphate 1-O-acyltransferase PlsB [Chitinivorax sp. B]|uniref:glycerol-3-phosphate 1-O-acyltransferase PlsB n=1 Tax=Chitinivorax sp. B TaxID=2502235 RepID=UPI0010F59A1A|nr:glycerol-3-phosphate 1-O-acyltransferase PlsB [Chitinivorax sp. B]
MLKFLGLEAALSLLSRKLLYLWVRTQVLPQDLTSLKLDPDKPVCYVLQTRQLSNLLVLETETIRTGLPRAMGRFQSLDVREDRSFFFLTRGETPGLRRKNRFAYSPRLKRLVQAAIGNPKFDVQLVPVTILWGRQPQKEDSLLKILFTDSWATPSALKQLFRVLIHGRGTLVRFEEPISLREMADEGQGEELTLRKIARVLRVHFRRQREMAIGPDLSHRRTQVTSLLDSEPVRKAIEEEAREKNVLPHKVEENARRYVLEIAADYSYPTVRAYEKFLTWLWTRLYDGVRVYRMNELVDLAASGPEIIYVPTHRSHIDYLLMSYVIFKQGMMVPHIAAGANLNLPVVGGILRRGGAFFLRRTFKGNNLYAAVFNEYLHMMIQKGYPIEYFIEGGRSRTGRLLSPKGGMLAMTLASYLRDHNRPIVFVPIYFGYEKVMEGGTYVAELSGKPKEKESIWGLIKTIRDIEKVFGEVHVNFGQPIPLADLLDEQYPGWRDESPIEDTKVPWVTKSVDVLANRIVTHINGAAVVNPINLLAFALLSTPKQVADEDLLVAYLDTLRKVLADAPYTDRVEMTPLDGRALIEYGMKMKVLQRLQHPLGNLIQLEPQQALQLTYFRNNIQHLYTLPGMIACFLTSENALERSRIVELISNLYPFLQAELFLHWRVEELDGVINTMIDAMIEGGLLAVRSDQTTIKAPNRNSAEYMQLEILARSVRQAMERYYIAVALLTRQGSGKITAAHLEELCSLFAQRLAILHEHPAPEFFDKGVFRSFIQTLKRIGILCENEQRQLVFDRQLQAAANEAQIVLPHDVRQTVQQLTRLDAEEIRKAVAEIAAKSKK